ncbi:efflux RND transporter periplasmic adaptor subunit [Nitrospira lenta]|uniref:Putative Secretion protein HlyD family n=1 Tax=Nitrospira lenta TaxID=1436998 RepID=A0A330LD11_9BACT|nr:efflux RND transporter periplasmic adaptor subunit [Nitrospira lenta]SPP66886.1 putative Secretion protein HlyD family [Nitrospira lenta]
MTMVRSVSQLCIRGLSIVSVVLGMASLSVASDLSCLILPYMEVAIGSPVEGLLESVTVERGDVVKKGQVLATLESSVEKATVALARAKAGVEAEVRTSIVKEEFALRKLARASDLVKSSSIAAHEADEAKTEKRLAEIAHAEAVENTRLAELELQRSTAALSLRTIRSPIAGVVVERHQHPGELVNKDPILKLAQIDPLRVEVFAPLPMLGQVAVGMQADVRPSDPPGGVYKARVSIVNKVVDSASGTFGIRLEIPNHDHRLSAGLHCSVNFLSSQK